MACEGTNASLQNATGIPTLVPIYCAPAQKRLRACNARDSEPTGRSQIATTPPAAGERERRDAEAVVAPLIEEHPVTGIQSTSPAQLRELRSAMEDDFARLLCAMTEVQAQGSSPYHDASSPVLESGAREEVDDVLYQHSQGRLAAIAAALRRFDIDTYG